MEYDPAVYNIQKSDVFFYNTKATTSIVFDLSHVLKVDSVIMRKRNYHLHNQQMKHYNTTSKNINKGKRDSVSIYYKAPNWHGFGSFIQSTHNNFTISLAP